MLANREIRAQIRKTQSCSSKLLRAFVKIDFINQVHSLEVADDSFYYPGVVIITGSGGSESILTKVRIGWKCPEIL